MTAGRSDARPVRVVLSDLPRLLRGFIAAALADSPDFELVEDPRAVIDADVVLIAGAPGDSSAAGRSLLARYPRTSVVVVSTDEAESLVRYELWPQATDVGEPSAARLIEALHGATPWARRFRAPDGAVR